MRRERLATPGGGEAVVVERWGSLTDTGRAAITELFARHPRVDVVYGDSFANRNLTARPDFAPIWLRSADYLGPVVAVRRGVAPEIESAGSIESVHAGVLSIGARDPDRVRRSEVPLAIELRDPRPLPLPLPLPGLSAPGMTTVVVSDAATPAGMLEATLESLLLADARSISRIVVVDIGTARTLRLPASVPVDVIRVPAEAGRSAAMAEGMSRVDTEFALLINDDIDLVTTTAAATLAATLMAHPAVAAIAGVTHRLDGAIAQAGLAVGWGSIRRVLGGASSDRDRGGLLRAPRESTAVCSDLAVVRTLAYREIGGHDPSLEGDAADLALGLELAKAGWSVAVDGRVRAYDRLPPSPVDPGQRSTMTARWATEMATERFARTW